jgi:hypothetical protein
MAAYPGCSLGDNIKFLGANYLASGKSEPSLSVQMQNLPGQGCAAALVQKQVKMCPGIKYELSFAMGYVNKVSDSQVVSNADCTVRWLTGTPGSWNSNDNYQSSPNYEIGFNHPSYKSFGPWTLHVSEGDLGVTKKKKKKNLFVDLTAVIQCTGPAGGAGLFVVRDIQLNQVGFVKARSLITDDEKENRVLERAGPTTNITEQLAPYFPDQKTVLSVSATTKNISKRDESVGDIEL